MESSTADIVRNFFMQERGEHRVFLNRIGDKIHRESTPDPEWVRVTTLPEHTLIFVDSQAQATLGRRIQS